MANIETRSCGSTVLSGVCGIALVSAAWAMPSAADAQTIVMVIDPPTNETNRYWETGGDFGLNPAMQPLVGQDPVTAEYDASGVARAWEHNEDFTTWTFHLHEDAEFHFNAYVYSGGRPVNIVEHPEVEALYPEFRASLDPEERDAKAQEIFRILFENYFSVPIASVNSAVAVDPAKVAGWRFPGVTSIGLSHFHLVEPAN